MNLWQCILCIKSFCDVRQARREIINIETQICVAIFCYRSEWNVNTNFLVFFNAIVKLVYSDCKFILRDWKCDRPPAGLSDDNWMFTDRTILNFKRADTVYSLKKETLCNVNFIKIAFVTKRLEQQWQTSPKSKSSWCVFLASGANSMDIWYKN